MASLFTNSSFIGTKENVNTFVLEKEFNLDIIPSNVSLKATALGIYFIMINGRRVDDNFLAPGWTAYKKMLQVQSYNVKDYLRVGLNKIEMVVNVGWYAGRLAWENNYQVYGKVHAGRCELVLGDNVIGTDLSWKARSYNIIESSIYDGEKIDYCNEIADLCPTLVDYPETNLVEQICEPVRTTISLDVVDVITTPSGDTVYDFGQNIAGVVSVMVPEGYNEEITLKFAEILINGEFYTENLRSAKATDIIKNAGGKEVIPEFTFHGFRYLHVDTKKPLDKSCFKALVRHTDMELTGVITASDPSFNKLMENVTWGQRGNFVDIPTDCPQRDERLGWTGDINAFGRTACYNFNAYKILKKFLCSLRDDQLPTGEISHVSPDCLFNGAEPSALWTDVICFLPWTLYEMYGNLEILQDNYEAMKKYIHALEQRMEDGLVVKGQIYGDWLALDNEVVFSEDAIGRTNKHYLGSVFYVEDCRIISKVASLLGNKEDEILYNDKATYSVNKIRDEYFNKYGRLLLDTLTAQVLALHFNIVSDENRAALAKDLADNIKRHKFHVTTGFIGTAYLLFALSDNGYFDFAAKLMMNHEYPGWLYEVDMGATTTWERWSSLMPNGQPDSKGMNSYNHYAYGAMKEFVYRKVLGIECVTPGFKKICLAPHVVTGLDEISGSYKSVNGLIKSSYKVLDNEVVYDFYIPSTITADIYIDNEYILRNVTGDIHLNRKK